MHAVRPRRGVRQHRPAARGDSQADICYAVKVNAEPALPKLLAESGYCFDVASPQEKSICAWRPARCAARQYGPALASATGGSGNPR
ncbi:hypothetical protein [Streptomyces decoyicus]|uniref:hypothetical protein n=1 Tax=Streptomyces decoyicus TaxID=249567 RepID=UPI00399A5EA8